MSHPIHSQLSTTVTDEHHSDLEQMPITRHLMVLRNERSRVLISNKPLKVSSITAQIQPVDCLYCATSP